MGLFNWAEDKLHKISIYDFTIVKICIVLLGIIIGAYVSDFVKENIILFLTILLISYFYIIYKVFIKK